MSNSNMKSSILAFLCFTMLFVIIFVVVILVIKFNTNDNLNLMKDRKSFHLLKHPDAYELKFPEELFPPIAEKKEEYEKYVRLGYKLAENKKIIIAGLARDIKQDLIKNFERISKVWSKPFKDYRVLVFENDSNDGTAEFLEHYMKKVNPKFIKIDIPADLTDKMKSDGSAVQHGLFSVTRFKKMAYFRNLIVNEIRKNYSDFDYVWWIDLDLKGTVSMDGVMTNFGFAADGYDWDMMSGMGLAGKILDKTGKELCYYDTLAYIPYGKKSIVKQDYIRGFFRTMTIHEYKIPERGTPPIQVLSAFGGSSIYKMKVVLDERINYSGEECEHICYHKKMIELGYDKIFINPNFILLHTMSIDRNPKKSFEKFLFKTFETNKDKIKPK